MQILEYFDDKPDDSANWGIAISSLDELKDDALEAATRTTVSHPQLLW